jgi:phospholipid/cholesterol/gamma-HCH transport system substrate-binding protein
MKFFSERNPLIVGVIGIALTAAAVLLAVNYKKLPFVDPVKSYSAYFAEAGGIRDGAAVQVSGLRVGQVTHIRLDGARVVIDFVVAEHVRLGERTEAAIKTKSLLGAKVLELTPRGQGQLITAIPIDRTTPPYQLPDALGDLTTTISGLNTDQLSDSLNTLAQTFHDTPPDVRAAIQGVGRFSQTLNDRDAQLRDLLTHAANASAVLSERAGQVATLVSDANALLVQLRTQSAALEQISHSISAVSQQFSGLVSENRDTLKPALDKLNGVLKLVDDRKDKVQQSIKLLNAYGMSLGESVSSGPFFKAYVANLLPGQFIQPFVDAAFSDLGLDPNVLLPTQLADPQTGQPAIPALPVPYPRTGQGGDPRLTLPDAITGSPGDLRYPYNPPPPQPAPGGPPPGPPAGYIPGAPPPAPPTDAPSGGPVEITEGPKP